MAFKYKTIRVVCKGKIKGCEHCKDTPYSEGYCKYCRRPLWREIGDTCNSIVAYFEGSLKQGKEVTCKCGETISVRGNKEIGVDVICKECNSITSF